jgi:hypothetical protein
MPKRRKTRSEKQVADGRRTTMPLGESALNTSTGSYSYSYTPATQVNVSSPRTAAISTSAYGFVLSDLRRTLILTSSIIALQLILYFLTK